MKNIIIIILTLLSITINAQGIRLNSKQSVIDSTRLNATGDSLYYYQNGVVLRVEGITGAGGGTSYNNISETADTVFISGDLNVDANTLRVDATNNNVGIGTSSPINLLSLYDPNFPNDSIGFNIYKTGATASQSAVKVVSNNNGASFGVQNHNSTGFSGVEFLDYLGVPRVFAGYRSSTNEFRFNNFASGGYMDFMIGGSSKIHIANNGNVGIGTSSPSATLDVVSGTGKLAFDGERLLLYDNASLTDGYNVFIGEQSGNGNADDLNVAIGYQAGKLLSSTARANVYLGAYTAALNTLSGEYNLGIGYGTLYRLTSGNGNLALGTGALDYVTTGSDNIAIGFIAGRDLTTGSDNIYIGNSALPNSDTVTNEIVIGSDITGNGSNSVTLGNSSITKTILNGNVGIGTTSPSEELELYNDQNTNTQLKIVNTSGGTNTRAGVSFWNGTGAGDYFAFLLNGDNYNGISGWNDRFTVQSGTGVTNGLLFYSDLGGIQLSANGTNTKDIYVEDATGNVFMENLQTLVGGETTLSIDPSTYELRRGTSSIRYKENITDYDKGLNYLMNLRPVMFNYIGGNRDVAGFIAEEVKEIGLDEYIVYNNELVDGLTVNNLKPLIVKAIQEQQAIIETQQSEIDQLKTLITDLTNRIQILENK